MSPEALDQVTIVLDPTAQILLALAIMLMMFAIALGLKREHFSFLRAAPGQFWTGLAAQIIGLPAMTLALAVIVHASPSIALGMIVVAACPGGTVSNFMTFAARGDTAYSVSLTAGSSVVAAFWTPAAILFWSGLYPPTAELLETIDFDRTAFVIQTTLLLAGPLTAGMAAAHYLPKLSDRMRGPLALMGAAILVFVIIDSVIGYWWLLRDGWVLIAVPVIAHNAAAFALGAGAGRLISSEQARRRSLTFEVGIQNTGLAVVLLLGQLKGLGGAATIAAVWGIWHFVSGGAMIAFFRYLDWRKARP